ncbi:hypothetical protein [Bacillus sp. EB600]|uniref:hypothetical protein n=1 Tax=Bacillus sp. EB600 TaxID=2806345 RepID=UPI00210A107E|nr:hypothetical protein [Bacillus sp. EB600]MCQ6278790.1 hypothetical protein [Bacillus sp. EB600]
MAANKKQYNKESVEANQMMDEKFKDYRTGSFSAAGSEVESANQQIQKQFYEHEESNNYLPFHVESGVPPIKK